VQIKKRTLALQTKQSGNLQRLAENVIQNATGIASSVKYVVQNISMIEEDSEP
jgi:hypothetical protein